MILARARTFIALLAVLPVAPVVRAQIVVPGKGEVVPTFEVDTVKPSSRDLGSSFHTHIWWDDNSYRTQNTTLRDLIRNAFNATSSAQLTGGPDALLDSRFDLSAKIGDDDFARLNKLSDDDRNRAVHLMLQALLEERFGLKTHVETRELPVFDLVVDKGGSKLQPVADPVPAAAGETPGSAVASKPGRNVSASVSRNHGTLKVTDAGLDALTGMLSHQTELDGRMVIDKTGLTGKYNFALEWSPQRLNPAADSDSDGPSLFAALREQLGLRLEAARGEVEIVVVDAVSSPTPN